MAEVLKKAGLTTGVIGKYGLSIVPSLLGKKGQKNTLTCIGSFMNSSSNASVI